MASTYPIHYDFIRCTNNGSSNTYTNDFVTFSMFKAKAVDGCFFQENDGGNCYFTYNGGKRFDLKLTKVSPSDDQKVINGELTGITSDGKYCCRRVRLDYSISGDIYVTLNATGGSPILPVIVYNKVAHTKYKTEVQGSDTKITLTCDDGYTFDGVPKVTFGTHSSFSNMTVSGNVATFKQSTASYEGTAFLEGKTKAVVQTVSVTNNVAHTTYQKEVQGDNTVITLTCDDGYTFDGVPTVTYGGDPEDPFAESSTADMTVSGNVATFTLATDSYGGSATLDGNTKEVIPEPQNNITGATYTTEQDPFTEATTVTITCNDGLMFDGVPTVKYVNTTGHQTVLSATLNGDKTVGTVEITDLKYIVSLDGNTKPKPVEPVEPTEPTVTNNVPDSKESHTVDGHSVTVKLSSNKVMLDVSCAYVSTDGSSKNVPVTVDVVVTPLVDSSNVTSNASVTLPDVDFNSPVVISGESKKAIRIDYYLSGCTTDARPTYCFVGEPITFNLTADSGNIFDEPDKCKLVGYSVFAPVYTEPMSISEDKLTATGTITPTVGTSQRDDFYIEVHGVANPQSTPTKKYGFINAYVLNEKNLEDFATARFVQYTGDVGSTKEDPISYDLGDYINRVKRFFFQVAKGSTSKLMCGNFMVDTTVYNLDSDTQVLSFGSVEIPNVTQSTADYDTELNMFVPFIGLESLPVDLIGHTVALELRVNLLGGGGVYVMTCDDRIVWTKEVEPCSDVLFRTQKQQIQVIGGSKFDSTYLMGLTPYIVLQKKTITSTGVETASSRLTKVKDVSGFTKMVNVKFADTTNMLTDDVNTIINILRNGFTL
jgi:hypothetical protein